MQIVSCDFLLVSSHVTKPYSYFYDHGNMSSTGRGLDSMRLFSLASQYLLRRKDITYLVETYSNCGSLDFSSLTQEKLL